MSGYEFPVPFGESGAAWKVAADLIALFVPLFGGEFADAVEEFGITNRDQRQRDGRVFVGTSGRGNFEAQASAFITGGASSASEGAAKPQDERRCGSLDQTPMNGGESHRLLG